jgi:multidrug efflux pump subunit AcrB
MQVNVDRDKAAEIGLNERDVANSVLLSLTGSGQVSPIFWLNPKNGIQYLINVRAPEHTMDSVSALQSLPVGKAGVTTDGGQLLTNLADLQRAQGPAVVSHYNVTPVVDVFGNVSGRDLGGVLGEVMPFVEEAKKELPRGSFILVKGQAQTMETSFTGLGAGLVIAIVLIYLLLVINFQSWLDPFIIITALPAALAGVAWGLYVTNTTLSVPALMGAIMSLGVATANSVLVVSFARERLREGMSSSAAALAAGSTRLRAVIMTALAMIIGMVPMSLGLGEGGEQNAPLARAVIGGLLLATVATLFFVPAVFSILHRKYRPAKSPAGDGSESASGEKPAHESESALLPA